MQAKDRADFISHDCPGGQVQKQFFGPLGYLWIFITCVIKEFFVNLRPLFNLEAHHQVVTIAYI
jgi:hypothetical protein